MAVAMILKGRLFFSGHFDVTRQLSHWWLSFWDRSTLAGPEDGPRAAWGIRLVAWSVLLPLQLPRPFNTQVISSPREWRRTQLPRNPQATRTTPFLLSDGTHLGLNWWETSALLFYMNPFLFHQLSHGRTVGSIKVSLVLVCSLSLCFCIEEKDHTSFPELKNRL